MKRVLPVAALVAAFFCASAAHAAVTFGASVTNANGTLSTVLTWNAPGASGCTASGHPSWVGAKAASGTLALPPITLSGTYSLTIACSTPGNGAATVVSWTAPTTNTDDTALVNLAGFKIVYGNSASALTQSKSISSASATSADVGALAAGAWFFAVRAINAAGVESGNSNVASKTVTVATVENSSVSLTVNPIPNSATNVTAN